VCRRTKTTVLIWCLAVTGCGPLLDKLDDERGLVGRYTPYGEWKRDFWGRRYLENYPLEPTPDRWSPGKASDVPEKTTDSSASSKVATGGTP
jgi:hypothetical protein